MSNAILLDILFGIIALLFVPIGLRRGVQREICVTAGLLVGAQLSASWTNPWGSDFASQINVRGEIGEFVVAGFFLIGSTIALGYGGSAAIRMAEPGGWGRIAGAVISVTNGTLLTALILRNIERIHFIPNGDSERTLERSHVAWTLLRQFGWVLIGASAIMLIMIVLSLLFGGRPRDAMPIVNTNFEHWQEPVQAAIPSSRRPRLNWGSDEGKVEPLARAFDQSNGRYGADVPNTQQTIPIAPVESSMWSEDRARDFDRRSGEWLEIATQEHSEWPKSAKETVTESTILRCPSCGEALTNEDMFCPRCGRARST